MSQELAASDMSELFAKQRRRVILRVLRGSEAPLTITELAHRLRERQIEPPAVEDVDTVRSTLSHNYLPGLEDDDAVIYDQQAGTVHPGPNFDEALRDWDVYARRIDLLVRTTTPAIVGERLDVALDRLAQLDDDGFITDYRVRQWPPKGSAGATCRASSSFTTRKELIAEFATWAEQHGYTLQPAFQRQADALPTSAGEPRERYLVPLLTLAFYDDETLTGVIPCADEQYTYTVTDFLSARSPTDRDWIDRSDNIRR